ncbi:MAG: lectin-like protein [Methanomicrobiaceae archaeon]|nr:lectin-like protein [Methanomicrobiaceae archaeon]
MKKQILAGIVILLCTGMIGTGSAVPVQDPDTGHYYELFSASHINFSEASEAASGMTLGGDLCPGHLATVTSQDENDFIVDTFTGSLDLKWIGGFQDSVNSSTEDIGWEWITGEPWSYTNWNAGEPNNWNYGGYGYEDAVTYWGETGVWNDAPNGWRYYNGGYIVEFDCMQVSIDIKLESDPNSININAKGVIPVAILTTGAFDAATVDPLTVDLDGMIPRPKGRSGNVGSMQDVDGDGDRDLVIQIEYTGIYGADDTVAILHALTFGGANIYGQDSIRIVPP